MATLCTWAPKRPSLHSTAASASCQVEGTRSCCGTQMRRGNSSAASRARTHSAIVKTTSRSSCHSIAATCSPAAQQPSAPCAPTSTWRTLLWRRTRQGMSSWKMARVVVPLTQISSLQPWWSMASSTLEQSAASRGMTRPSPGARASAPPRLRAPSTGYKTQPLWPQPTFLRAWAACRGMTIRSTSSSVKQARSLSSLRTPLCPASPASARHRGTTEGSAICVFTMKDVQKAFNGLYKEVNRETQQWYTVTHPVPMPRPGACITSSARERRINSSLQLPDRVLNFLKDHFLMDGQVRSHMLLLQPRARYQRVAVHRVVGLHDTYDVLFLGTGDGRLHKAVNVGSRVHIIEELQVFPPGQPVQNLLLDANRGLLYAASYSGVVQVPVANCSLYQSCGDCLLARDPYCAWSGASCRHISLQQPELASRLWIQDIEGANAKGLCNTSWPRSRTIMSTGKKLCEQVQFQPNTVNTLACPLPSNLATRLWMHNEVPVNASASCRVLPTGDLLLLVGSQQRLGLFQCWSLENGFQQLVASYCPEMVEDGAADQADQGGSVPVIINTSRVSAPVGTGTWSADKSYWNEFLVMCVLFVFAVVLLTLFFLYRHRDGMKVFLKQGECASVHPKTRPVGRLPETRPLNGVGPPSTPLDHRGYQALSGISPGPRVFTESEKRPLSIQDSFVEVSPMCPRPRVRLGSEIRDSVV
ncbi:semaphorin-4B isoform X3 [Trichechus manatus latirostris]|uniref:Semaphorin-4B isoform X3 n=1 Tax=Trichechus manatus latirostris TaxID=127582 RepID=A0A2Y9QE60_TRIMA|nr:semaphorin-4B isoform X3 [Trichechus manatus latirostris]